MNEEFTYHISEIDKIASNLLAKIKTCPIWLFDGEMGAGKTTLISSICSKMEVLEQPSSPTFSIVNEYESPSYGTVYHFDFYRLERFEEALDIGVEEYFDSGSLCLIEWGEKITPILPEQNIIVKIDIIDESSRKLSVSLNG